MCVQEVNPSLGTSEEAVRQTVAVGCSLARSALGAFPSVSGRVTNIDVYV